ncbi:hypothetical protein JYK00_04650 [Thermosipho ferrireducens]|uniref:Outer membrane protein beta-barrel domain-containing protein n=1 Tax=Thermosipho ferrireducens TaxID=2571116 RepID=A0ABX7S889_9BACT|nr:hypothetical protein [Thermosipho ferrireducens]QTA38801.1 hypothetical protein JYK00_04650 [Thermosipho ferrireducens]
MAKQFLVFALLVITSVILFSSSIEIVALNLNPFTDFSSINFIGELRVTLSNVYFGVSKDLADMTGSDTTFVGGFYYKDSFSGILYDFGLSYTTTSMDLSLSYSDFSMNYSIFGFGVEINYENVFAYLGYGIINGEASFEYFYSTYTVDISGNTYNLTAGYTYWLNNYTKGFYIKPYVTFNYTSIRFEYSDEAAETKDGSMGVGLTLGYSF